MFPILPRSFSMQPSRTHTNTQWCIRRQTVLPVIRSGDGWARNGRRGMDLDLLIRSDADINTQNVAKMTDWCSYWLSAVSTQWSSRMCLNVPWKVPLQRRHKLEHGPRYPNTICSIRSRLVSVWWISAASRRPVLLYRYHSGSICLSECCCCWLSAIFAFYCLDHPMNFTIFIFISTH